jgi:hypothetical protein
MSKSLFEQYEEDRKYFKPGTILITKENTVVRKLKIINPNHYVGDTSFVLFEVLDSLHDEIFRVGNQDCWDKSYIKRTYRPEELSNV